MLHPRLPALREDPDIVFLGEMRDLKIFQIPSSASVAVTVDAPLAGGGCGAAPMASSLDR